MPRKIRLAFQLAPLNSSPVATRIVYMRITFFYTHVTSLYPDAGAAYEARSKSKLGARDHERGAQRERERSVRIWEIFACSIDLIEEFVCLLRWLGPVLVS